MPVALGGMLWLGLGLVGCATHSAPGRVVPPGRVGAADAQGVSDGQAPDAVAATPNPGCRAAPQCHADIDCQSAAQAAGSCVVGRCDACGACVFEARVGCCASDAACDDANPCTEDACLGPAGCVHAPVAGACNDANPCTANDACNAQGQCEGEARGA